MGSQAQSNRMMLSYAKEAVATTGWNVVPASNKQCIFINSETLKPTKETIRSERLRANRMGGGYMQVMQGAEGDTNFELGYRMLDDWLEAVMMNTWVTVDLNQVSVTVSTTHTIAVTGATFQTDNVKVGMKIRMASWASLTANNGAFTIASITNQTTVVVTETLSDGTDAGVDVNVHCIRNGVTETAFSLIKSFQDMTDVNVAGARIYHTGCEADRWRYNAEAKRIVDSTISWIGGNTVVVEDGAVPGGGAFVDALEYTPYVGSLNMCPIKEAGADMSVALSALSFDMNNNIRQRAALGCPTSTPRRDRPISLAQGDVEITGQVQIFFENLDLYKKFLADDRTSLEFQLHDVSESEPTAISSNYFIVTLPSVELMGEDTPASGLNTDIIETLDFGAEPYQASDSEEYMIQVDSFA